MATHDTDPPKLYESREPIFPKRVNGHFRKLKWASMAVMLGLYYILPWIRWDRGPALPDQAVLVDLANRRFFFFWIEIWPHEFYFVAGLLIMAGLGLFLFTSALGRVWCGYACPQTVWTDLFMMVERAIEGDRNARMRLHQAPWNARKARLRLSKWTAWLLIAVATGGAWVFYFTDAPTLLRDLLNGTAHPVAYTTIAIMTATTFFFGGFAREQICIYACPWPRIQAAMMDEDTLTVGYRFERGEPRGKIRKGEATKSEGGEKGDCIDCLACVNVCPMGIDIRDGQQLECITCALCIDACDDVMHKIGKPRGLIDYMALKDETTTVRGQKFGELVRHILRPRTLLYFGLWSLIGVGLIAALVLRSPVEISVSPQRNPLYVMLSDGSIRNNYDLRIRNMSGDEHRYRVEALTPTRTAGDDIAFSIEGVEGDIVAVAPDQMSKDRIYLVAPPGSELSTNRSTPITIRVTDLSEGTQAETETAFNGAEGR